MTQRRCARPAPVRRVTGPTPSRPDGQRDWRRLVIAAATTGVVARGASIVLDESVWKSLVECL
jgi:hypothetical protein